MATLSLKDVRKNFGAVKVLHGIDLELDDGGFLVLLGSAWALWYHFLAGIRHFFYDAGEGLEIETARKSSIAIVAGSVVLTLLSLIIYLL